MSSPITLSRARLAFRQMVWCVDCLGAMLGWIILLLLAVSGFSMMIIGFLLGDFFTHYIEASAAARASFHLFAIPALAALYALTVWMRWSTRPTATLDEGADHVPAE
jgi:hypothetical protein